MDRGRIRQLVAWDGGAEPHVYRVSGRHERYATHSAATYSKSFETNELEELAQAAGSELITYEMLLAKRRSINAAKGAI